MKIKEKLLWFFIIGGLIIRFGTAFYFNPLDHLWSDMGLHWTNATQPLNHNPPAAFQPIMYQIWLGIIAQITAGDRLAIGIYAGLFSVLTPLIWYLFLKEFFREKPIFSLISLLILAWLPSWIGIYSYFMNETLALPLLGLALYLTQKHLVQNNLKSFSFMTASWLLASLTRVSILPLAIISLIYIFVQFQHERAKKLIVLSILSILLLLPSAYRTYSIIGAWEPFSFSKPHQVYMKTGCKYTSFSINGFDWGFGVPSFYGKPFLPLSDWEFKNNTIFKYNINSIADWKLVEKRAKDYCSPNHKKSAFELEEDMWDQGFEQNNFLSTSQNGNTHFLDLIPIRLRNLLFFFFGEPWPDNNSKHLFENLNVKMRWLCFPLLISCLIGNLKYFLQKQNLPLPIILNTIIWILCCCSSSVGESRYHKPFEGLLIINLIWLFSVFYQASSLKAQEFLIKKN